MSKYLVTFTTTASISVEVEGENELEAEEVALNSVSFPYFPGGMDGDLSDDWETSSIDEVES